MGRLPHNETCYFCWRWNKKARCKDLPCIRAKGSRGARAYDILGGWQRSSDRIVCREESDASYHWSSYYCQCCYNNDPWEYWWEISSDEEIEWAPPIIFETSLEDLVKPQRTSRRKGGSSSLKSDPLQEDDSWDDLDDLMSLGSVSDASLPTNEDDWEVL